MQVICHDHQTTCTLDNYGRILHSLTTVEEHWCDSYWFLHVVGSSFEGTRPKSMRVIDRDEAEEILKTIRVQNKPTLKDFERFMELYDE